MSAMDGQRVRLCVLLCMSLSWKLLLMFDAIGAPTYDCGRNLTLIHHACAVQTIRNNGGVDSALIFIRSLNVLNGCHIGRARTGRTFVVIAACAIDLTGSCYWCLMQ